MKITFELEEISSMLVEQVTAEGLFRRGTQLKILYIHNNDGEICGISMEEGNTDDKSKKA